VYLDLDSDAACGVVASLADEVTLDDLTE